MRAKHLVTVGLAAVALAACSATPQDPYTNPRQDYLSKYGTNNQSVFGEGGLSLNPFGKKNDQGGGGPAGIGVNTYLWRASLDTVSFMPLASADPFGGVIITDWYSPPDTPNERFKVNIFILDRQLRADGIRAAVFRQRREADGRWQDVATDATTQTEMENAILTRARQLRVSTAER
jgi:Domain of unknown function (DUF3576)